jgi:ATP-dependent helicase/nuclease subunit B
MTRPPRVFSIPAGAAFLPTLAAALLDGRLAGPFDLAADPLALARATVFLPNRRAARAFAAVLAEHLAPRTVLMPRIVPIGDIDEAETALLSGEPAGDDAALDLPPAIDAR